MFFSEIIKSIKDKHDEDFIIICSNSKNDINNIVLSSRLAGSSNIFTAIKGFKADGHLFLNESYSNGCRDFIVENETAVKSEWLNDSTIIKSSDCRKAMALLSNFINGYPFDKLKMIGVTGTKGKTTVTTLIHHLLGNEASMFSTVNYVIAGKSHYSERTTMESIELQKLLKDSLNNNDKYSVVEVSSHAVTLKRVHGINWDFGIFTTFSRDHLDLYGTMENYFNAKLDFFKSLNNSAKKNKIAVINIDDPKGREVCGILNDSVKIVTVGKNEKALYCIKKINPVSSGQEIYIKFKNTEMKFKTNLRGDFNATNAALSVTLALELGISLEIIKKRLENFARVEGRFEIVIDKPFTVIIDYAHSPDSLEKILIETRKLAANRLTCVFGCTGERDRDKRSIMGEIAALRADLCILTNDDTYGEDENEIAREVEKGILKTGKKINKDYFIILDRIAAVEKALAQAENGDVILIAGMGHQKKQILKNGPVNYNDKDVVIQILNKMNTRK